MTFSSPMLWNIWLNFWTIHKSINNLSLLNTHTPVNYAIAAWDVGAGGWQGSNAPITTVRGVIAYIYFASTKNRQIVDKEPTPTKNLMVLCGGTKSEKHKESESLDISLYTYIKYT